MSSRRDRLPPHQALAAPEKWPIVGESRPRRDSAAWRVGVEGLVEQPRSWSLDELLAMPRVERIVDIHCVTRWSKLDAQFGGVPLAALLELCRPQPEARFISFVARSERGHSTSLPLADALELDPLVAFTYDDEPLEEIHGGPVRTVVAQRYFYKSLKWLETIELLERDRLGYWEAETGYHNVADPWLEQRFIVPDIDRREVVRLMETRDLRGRELLGMDADQRDLRDLDASAATLRDARFRRANLEGARFDRARLANAHFEGANLRGASFHGADLEGVNFRGADLSGADLRGESLFGATFCPEPGDRDGWEGATVDRETKLDLTQLDRLSPVQQEFMRQAG